MASDEGRLQRIIEGHKARNRELRATIAAYGIPLDKKRAVDLEFWAPDELAAKQLREALERNEFSVKRVGPPPPDLPDGRWALTAAMHASVDQVTEPETVEIFVRFADKYGCEFDGWGTALVELAPKQT